MHPLSGAFFDLTEIIKLGFYNKFDSVNHNTFLVQLVRIGLQIMVIYSTK